MKAPIAQSCALPGKAPDWAIQLYFKRRWYHCRAFHQRVLVEHGGSTFCATRASRAIGISAVSGLRPRRPAMSLSCTWRAPSRQQRQFAPVKEQPELRRLLVPGKDAQEQRPHFFPGETKEQPSKRKRMRTAHQLTKGRATSMRFELLMNEACSEFFLAPRDWKGFRENL
jgi:hypothetical protein